jgi:hypothetical protein
MRFWNLLIAAALALVHGKIYADTAIDYANRYTVGLILQDTAYKAAEKFNVEGQILQGGFKLPVMPKLAIGGGIGLMFDGNIGGGIQAANGGSGFRIFSDAHYEVHRFGRNKILVTGAFYYDKFSFSEAGIDADFATTDIKVGALILHYFKGFSTYAGAELVPYASGQYAYGEFTENSKRDSMFNLRIGGSYKLNKKFALRCDVLLLGEQTFLFASDFAI